MKNTVKMSLIATTLALAGCSGTSSSDQVYNAQTCLDKTSQGAAMNCYNMVSGNTTTAAYLIRCASILVFEGVSTPANLQTVVTNLSGSGANLGTASAALSFIASAGTGNPSNATDLAQAADAVTQCTASQSTGLTTLATLASIATAASKIASQAASGITDATINSNASTIVTALPQLPSLLSTTYTQNCTGTISSSNQSFCTQYTTALNSSGGNLTTAATSFLTSLH